MKLNELLEKIGLKHESEYIDIDSENRTYWKVTLKLNNRQLTTPYNMGSAHKGEPKAADVVYCIVSDAGSYEGVESVDDFIVEFGYADAEVFRAYSSGTRKPHEILKTIREGEQAYKACKKMAERLPQFFGEHYDNVRECAQEY